MGINIYLKPKVIIGDSADTDHLNPRQSDQLIPDENDHHIPALIDHHFSGAN
jgi:hypothetical protein